MLRKIKLTKSDCIHVWVIEPSPDFRSKLAPYDGDGEGTWQINGPTSPGVCSVCQETREFRNSTPTHTGLTNL